MKPVLKQKVAFFHPTGFIDGNNAIDIIAPLDIDELVRLKPDGIFISLKKVIFFNKRGICILVESLQRVREKNGAIIGFCDYNLKKYSMIIDIFKDDLFFSLFDTCEIAMLFLGNTPKDAGEKNIIIYHDNNEYKNQLAIELYERGYAPLSAKDEIEFTSKARMADFALRYSYLGNFDKNPTVFIRENIIIYTLKGFVDSTMDNSFDMLYHNNSLQVGFKVFLFDASNVSSINIHGVQFISKLSIIGAEYEAVVAICGLNARKISKKLVHDLEDSGVVIYPNITDIFADKELLAQTHSTQSVVKKSKGITKELISYLPVISEATLKTIEILSKHISVRTAIKIQPLEPLNSQEALSVTLGFYGDIKRVFILIFEKQTALECCKILLEEKHNNSELLEALSEFVHIVGGKIIQNISKMGKKIEITMPRTFENLKDIITAQKGKKGAQIDMRIDNKPLSLFLTK
ncbi:MAG: chemotaxis protein CheX [Sulfurospirillum sp.]|nr:chemotaxis protein CheX [Sulfurospirillum sp.]